MKIEIKESSEMCDVESVPVGDVFAYDGAFFLLSAVEDTEAVCVNLATGKIEGYDVEMEVEHRPNAKVVFE